MNNENVAKSIARTLFLLVVVADSLYERGLGSAFFCAAFALPTVIIYGIPFVLAFKAVNALEDSERERTSSD